MSESPKEYIMNALNIALQQKQIIETQLALPYELKEKFPLQHKLAFQVAEQRQTIQNLSLIHI